MIPILRGGGAMAYSRYLLIKRWKEAGAPPEIRNLRPGARVKLKSGGFYLVERVGIGRVLLEKRGWVAWQEIEISAKGTARA